MSRCMECGSKGECLEWCGDSPEVYYNKIQEFEQSNAELKKKLEEIAKENNRIRVSSRALKSKNNHLEKKLEVAIERLQQTCTCLPPDPAKCISCKYIATLHAQEATTKEGDGR